MRSRSRSEGLRIELIEGKNGNSYESSAAPSSVRTARKNSSALLANRTQDLCPTSCSLEGHTDSTPYSDQNGYSNWELSADRANSARKLLQQDGVRPNQVTQVRGYADQLLRVKNNPSDPSNRRISILVKNETEDVPVYFADKVVNGSTLLPGTPKAEAQNTQKDQKPVSPPTAPPASKPAGSPSAAPPASTPKPSAATPAAIAQAPAVKPSMMDRLKNMLPGKKS